MSLEAWGNSNPDDDHYESWSDHAVDAGWFNPDDYSPGALAILKERERQETKEGWSPEHDDGHTDNELAIAAAIYALPGWEDCSQSVGTRRLRVGLWPHWPWDKSWWKPKSRRENLIRAGALIAAEIDRLDRQEAAADE